jgi:hypothetical protein
VVSFGIWLLSFLQLASFYIYGCKAIYEGGEQRLRAFCKPKKNASIIIIMCRPYFQLI